MPFWKKSSPDKVPVASEEKTLYPVLHIINCLKDYRNELVQKEVSSLSEISEIGHSFEDVLSENENFQEKLQEFGSSFSSIEEVSGQFSAVKDTIAQSVDAAQSGVDELRDSSMQVKTYFDEMEHTFEDLQNAIEKIRQSTSKIVSIAEQTNILALNASIEAARAGDAGQGFSVVSDEVRNLASKSAEAARDTSTLIGRSLQDIQTGTESTNLAISAMQVINECIQSIKALMDEISLASVQQSEMIVSVKNRIKEVSKVIEENSDAAEESAAISNELSDQAKTLNHLISQFRIK